MNSDKGMVFIVSAPSGAGKTTLCRFACDKLSKLVYSVSYTTRPPRKNEKDGVDYYFISEKEFKESILKGDWIEWAKVHGNFYGTSRLFLQRHIDTGHDVLLDIDVQGAEFVLKEYSNAITIFVMPPSFDVLQKRLCQRGTDNLLIIQERLANAELEIEKKNIYKHIIINDDLEKAKDAFIAIFQ